MSPDESMRVLLAGALATSAGPAAALLLIRALVRHGMLQVLAAALRHQDSGSLLGAFGWTAPRATLAPASGSAPPPDAPSALLERMAAPWFTAWGSGDARSLWLACALYSVERPALMAQASLPSKAAAWIASACAAAAGGPTPSAIDPPSSHRPPSPGEWPSRSRVDETGGEMTHPAPDRSDEPFSASTPGAELADSPAALWTARAARAFTSRAGLFFLVPAMSRLGMQAWLEAHPELAEWNVPFLVLHAFALHLDTLAGDPALAALGHLPEAPPPEIQAAVREWMRKLRRFCRRGARIGPHSLICRHGRIAFTETHIDVLFRLDRADIRVRRAGLDIDPGWVPWLGRVIHFHYLSDEAYDA
jgi:hypothetical protein